MKDGPDIARIASLIGDPARANILAALMAGRALTSGELAAEAGIAPQTVAAHLARLAEAGLVTLRQQGRHRYWALAGAEVAQLLEALMGLADRLGSLRTRPGPRDAALRRARICYDHLAGEFGCMLHAAAMAAGALEAHGEGLRLAPGGATFFAPLGLDLDRLASVRRPLCRECLDWSERRSHLAGALGAACLAAFLEKGWARRRPESRVIAFTPEGERRFLALFGPEHSSLRCGRSEL